MKKFLALFLCTVLLLSFTGCSPQEEEAQLLVGYGRASIVPEYSMPLGGYSGSESRMFNNVLDPIYATCIAFTDQDGNTALLIQLDLGGPNGTGVDKAIQDLRETYSLNLDQIMISATHTHSAPHPTSSNDDFLTKYWHDLLRTQIVAAATQAMESRLSAEIYVGSIETKNLNFVRHYRTKNGSIAGNNFGSFTSDSPAVKHTQDADSELQLIRFKRQGGKDVVIANFQAHPLRTGGGTRLDLSSDFIGPMTVAVEESLDCHFAYFTGASGNIDPTSRISSENITDDHVEQGQALAAYAELAYYNLKKVNSGAVQTMAMDFIAHHTKSSTTTFEIPLTAFSIGDIGFVNAPYEMFSSNGEFIKDNSPFAITFVTTVGYRHANYIPDAATFAYDIVSYEESQCPYKEGTGEDLANAFVDMLKQLHSGTGVK